MDTTLLYKYMDVKYLKNMFYKRKYTKLKAFKSIS